MRRLVTRSAMWPAIVLVAILVSCGKPSGSEYLGKWSGATTPSGCPCLLEISRNGESFLLKVDDAQCASHGICAGGGGLFTLTPDGNLKGGRTGADLISFDKTSNQAVLSALGQLQYLKKIQ